MKLEKRKKKQPKTNNDDNNGLGKKLMPGSVEEWLQRHPDGTSKPAKTG